MKNILLATLAVGAIVAAAAPAEARDGCGPGAHRGPYGHRCFANGGPGFVPGAPAPVIGTYYPGRGYWSNGRYWHNRYRWHDGWRYR